MMIERADQNLYEGQRMRPPEEIADELFNNAFFTEDQAYIIAANIYQPLCEDIKSLKEVVARLTECLTTE